jgi:hypothetical protein
LLGEGTRQGEELSSGYHVVRGSAQQVTYLRCPSQSRTNVPRPGPLNAVPATLPPRVSPAQRCVHQAVVHGILVWRLVEGPTECKRISGGLRRGLAGARVGSVPSACISAVPPSPGFGLPLQGGNLPFITAHAIPHPKYASSLQKHVLHGWGQAQSHTSGVATCGSQEDTAPGGLS